MLADRRLKTRVGGVDTKLLLENHKKHRGIEGESTKQQRLQFKDSVPIVICFAHTTLANMTGFCDL